MGRGVSGGGWSGGGQELGALPAEDAVVEELPDDAEGHALCFVLVCVFCVWNTVDVRKGGRGWDERFGSEQKEVTTTETSTRI